MRAPVIFVVAACALALSGCGDEPIRIGKVAAPIYQGARETGEPWVVAVYYQRPGTTKLRLCTGSVIAPRAVLTAKHCVFDEVTSGTWTPVAASAFTVAVGDDITSAQGVIRELGVNSIVTTPGDYTQADALAGNDIALLKLNGDVGVEAKPVSLQAPVIDDEVRIIGFGFTENDDLGLKFAGTATVNKVDTGVFETNGPSWTCSGDSGGPALHTGRGEIVGVTSLGPAGCNTPRSIYTRVDKHAELLAEVLGVPAADSGACSGDGCAESGSPGGCEGGDCADASDDSAATPPGVSGDTTGSDSGCATTSRGGSTPAALLILGMLVMGRRRRRS
ncbi:MAG: trypsin-like serine protease [Deltaproteobacteria bacterium]|nr:trypsin-like serine protease [Deltaproteobacteria bacterium]